MTVAPERVILLTLWRYAFERRLVDSMPRGIVKIRRAPRPVQAWTIEQCCTAVNRAGERWGRGMQSGAPKSLFLRCWLLLGYETGARHQDLWRMRDTDFTDNVVSWTQGKTGQPHNRILSAPCLKAVRDMLKLSPDGRVLGWAVGVGGARKLLRQFLRRCGMGGSSKWLRRSGATHIEMAQPGKGRIHLGHRTVGMAEKHYIDWAQVRRDMPQTPQLIGD